MYSPQRCLWHCPEQRFLVRIANVVLTRIVQVEAHPLTHTWIIKQNNKQKTKDKQFKKSGSEDFKRK